MRSRFTIQIILTILIIVGTIWVLRSSQSNPTSTPCKESMDACYEKKPGSNKMIWEKLPSQFFSSL